MFLGDGKCCCTICDRVFEGATELLEHQMEEGHRINVINYKLFGKVKTVYYCLVSGTSD